MPNGSLDTFYLHHCVQRWQAGDTEAADVLFLAAGQRLEHMTRGMLRCFPAVRDWTETADVLQGSILRLLNTLRRLQPESTRHFFNLAAVHVRRELLNLARRFSGAGFVRPAPGDPTTASIGAGRIQEAAAPAEDDDLEPWCRFHQAVDQLPPEESEVISLVFYHGWTQAQVAELVEMDERTVRRRWQTACLRLNRLVGDQLPQP